MTLPGLAAAFLLSAAGWTFFPWWVCCLLGAAGCGSWWWIPREWRPHLMAGILAFAWCGIRQLPSPNDLSDYVQGTQDSIRIGFTVSGDPMTVQYGQEEPRFRIPAKVESIRDATEHAAHGRILVEVTDPEQKSLLQVGTHWEATGRIQQKDGPHTGLFRSRWRFYPDDLNQGASSPELFRMPMVLLFQVREDIRTQLESSLEDHPKERMVLQALLLGDRSDLSREEMDSFARSGLIHVFAISGLHIGMLAWMSWAVFRRLGLGIRLRGWVVTPILLIFVLFSGMGASSLRALVMLICLWAAPFFYRRTQAQQAFCLAVCILLAVSPGQIQDIGFQFSFLLVAGLLAFADSSVGRGLEWISPDPWAPPNPGQLWRMQHLWSRLLSALIVSGWCLLLSAPLTAYHFNLVSPIGFVGNLLAVPFVFLILLTGFPALMLALSPLPGSAVFLWIPRLLAGGLLGWSSRLESVPWGWQWVSEPSLLLILTGYLLLLFLWRRPQWTRPCLLGIVSLFLLDATQRILSMSRTELWVLPAERGQSFLLRRPFRPAVLVDTGSEWSGWRITDELRKRGVDRIDSLFLTHPDPSHTGGVPRVLESYHPDTLFGFSGDLDSVTRISPDLHPEGIHRGVTLRRAGWWIECVSPAEQEESRLTDERSLVIRFSAGFTSVLIMGGGGESVGKDLLLEGTPIQARVLCAGHPRSGALFPSEFLRTVDPEVVVFSGESFAGITEQRRIAEQQAAAAGRAVIRAHPGSALLLSLPP